MSNETNIQCISTDVVFDWVSRYSTFTLKETIQLPKTKGNEHAICSPFFAPCNGEKITLWNGSKHDENISTIAINLKSSCKGGLIVYINGQKVTTLKQGQSFSSTTVQLDLVEVLCVDEGDERKGCRGTFEMQIRTKKPKCEIKEIRCFLSNRHGQRIDVSKYPSSICHVVDINRRKQRKIPIHGSEGFAFLNEVDILIQGFITVQLLNTHGDICLSCLVPFSELETFFLCAPEGTNVQCDVTNFECKAFMFPYGKKCNTHILVNIKNEVCLSVYSFKTANLEIDTTLCSPRQEFNAPLCNEVK